MGIFAGNLTFSSNFQLPFVEQDWCVLLIETFHNHNANKTNDNRIYLTATDFQCASRIRKRFENRELTEPELTTIQNYQMWIKLYVFKRGGIAINKCIQKNKVRLIETMFIQSEIFTSSQNRPVHDHTWKSVRSKISTCDLERSTYQTPTPFVHDANQPRSTSCTNANLLIEIATFS